MILALIGLAWLAALAVVLLTCQRIAKHDRRRQQMVHRRLYQLTTTAVGADRELDPEDLRFSVVDVTEKIIEIEIEGAP